MRENLILTLMFFQTIHENHYRIMKLIRGVFDATAQKGFKQQQQE